MQVVSIVRQRFHGRPLPVRVFARIAGDGASISEGTCELVRDSSAGRLRAIPGSRQSNRESRIRLLTTADRLLRFVVVVVAFGNELEFVDDHEDVVAPAVDAAADDEFRRG